MRGSAANSSALSLPGSKFYTEQRPDVLTTAPSSQDNLMTASSLEASNSSRVTVEYHTPFTATCDTHYRSERFLHPRERYKAINIGTVSTSSADNSQVSVKEPAIVSAEQAEQTNVTWEACNEVASNIETYKERTKNTRKHKLNLKLFVCNSLLHPC